MSNETNQKAKILLVEDDQYTRELYEEILKDAGYTLETCSDGQKGLELIKKGGYRLILLDIMMPKLDGLSILEAMKKQNLAKNNGPVVVMTNLSNNTVVQDCLKKGAAKCLVKSNLNPDQLINEVKSILG